MPLVDDLLRTCRTVASTPPEESYPLLEKLGAENRSLLAIFRAPDYWALPLAEKFKLFNFWAFLFGPFYYFSKGLFVKGALIFGAFCLWKVLVFIFWAIFGIDPWFIGRWILPCLVTSHLASYDLFRFSKRGEVVWDGVPALFKTPQGFIGIPLASFLLVLMLPSSEEKVEGDSQPSRQVQQEPSRPRSPSRVVEPNAGKCPLVSGRGAYIVSVEPQGHGWEMRYQCADERSARLWGTISRSTMGGSICKGGRFDVRWVPCD
jgi:hypothetical protein